MASVPPQSHNAKRKASQGSSLLGQERVVGTQANNRKGNTSRIKRPSQENANRREQSVINKENKPTPKQYKSKVLNQIPTLGSPFVQQFATSSLGANSFHSLQSAKTAEASPISDAGYSLAESTSARSGCTCTTNMSDLVINTGFENDYLNGVSLLQVSSLAEQRKPGSAVLQPSKQHETIDRERIAYHSKSTNSGASDRHSLDIDTPTQSFKLSLKSTPKVFTPQTEVPQDDKAIRIRTPLEIYGHRQMSSIAPTATSLSPLSEPFFPRQTPRRSSDMYDIIGTNGNQATERVPHDYFLYNPVLPCDSSSNSFITVSSAAEDGQIFADDDYQYGGSLKVHVPGTSRSILAPAREDMPPSDSGLYFAITSSSSSSGPSNTSEHAQTTLSPGNSALPIIGEAEAETQGLEHESVIGESALQTKALSSLQLPEEEPSAEKIDLTPLVEHRDPLQTFAASKIIKGSTDARPYDDNATPRQCAVAANAVKETMLPHANTDTESRIFNHLSMENESSFVNGRQPESIACDTCQSVDQLFTRTRMLPCRHLACFSCLTASINIVGENGNQAKCTFCQQTVSDFMPGQRASVATDRASRRAVSALRKPSPPFNASHNATDKDVKSYTAKPPVIMRIDNIAWDATPETVEEFLPPNVLADTLQSVHLLIDRHDGKSKDYLFIEVKDLVAARSILQHRQNAVLGTGSRARPVTITLTTEEKLVEELRPDSRSEIMGLLELCNAAIARNIGHDDNNPKEGRFNKETTAYGWQTGGRHPLQTGVFLKSRYAPFWCALSVVSRLSIGHEVFWDMFLVIAGAISILAKHLVAIAASYENIGHDLAKPLIYDDADQTLAAGFSQQRAPRNNCALPPSSSSERNSNDNIDPNVADLNARIRERLEAETARDRSRIAKRLATRARLLGSSETEQERYQRGLCKSADSNGVHHARQGEWTQSDSQMLEKLVKVFEEKFGVQVELKDKA